MPVLEVKARRIGGATYQVPIEIRPERRQTLGLRWLVIYARKRHEKTMAEKLAGEIMDAVAGNGGAFKKKKICIKWLKLIELSLITNFKKQMKSGILRCQASLKNFSIYISIISNFLARFPSNIPLLLCF